MASPDTRPLRPESIDEEGLYWAAIHPIWKQVRIYDGADAFLERFAAVTEAQKLLLAAHWCQSEICNGGHHQFFANPTGVLAPEAVRGFELIEVPSAGDVVRRAIRAFGDDYPRDQDERREVLARLERPGKERAEWDPFYSLDDEFYAATGTGRFREQADAFVRAHLDRFFR